MCQSHVRCGTPIGCEGTGHRKLRQTESSSDVVATLKGSESHELSIFSLTFLCEQLSVRVRTCVLK